ASTRSARAIAAFTSRTSRSPSGPVNALALPLLATMAWMFPAGRRAAASRTGAAFAALTVKHPAAAHGDSLKTSARSFRAVLMPQLIPEYVNPRGVLTTALRSRRDALQMFEAEGLVPAAQ